ncbi:MAG TPA: hypothetical protein VH877_22405 [Polyangia bacterium]|jgi:hypothetical protein|nr:hypothetical protein [Polyangia bacterium]
MAFRYQVPGVYYEPRPRAPEAPAVRTDVAGFIGFEPRVRDGSTPSELLGTPPVGHAFRVDVAGFQLELGGAREVVPAAVDLVVSQDLASIPMLAGGSVSFALVAARPPGGGVVLLVVPGEASPLPAAPAPSDEQVEDAVRGRFGAKRPLARIADLLYIRSGGGDVVRPTVIPRLPPTRCDEWRDYLLYFGAPVEDGTVLAHAVRAFFANGGRRCFVQTVRRPRFEDGMGLAAALADFVGVLGSSEAEATGLERLLLVEQVSVVDAPDLHARRAVAPAPFTLPPRELEADFRRCGPPRASGPAVAASTVALLDPLYDEADVLSAQRAMMVRVAPERWRALLLLAAPLELDTSDGKWHGPSAQRAEAWRRSFDGVVGDLEMACAAMYHPWALVQEVLGGPTLELPPTPLAAGVIARRDLARGPHVAPANETLQGVVGLSRPVDDAVNAVLYDSPLHINVLRAFPGFGVQLWGARTLSPDFWLRFLNVRRSISAIERRVALLLRSIVFEPNTPFLWLQVSQLLSSVLLPLFESGALRGDSPDEAFYVRCDGTINRPEQLENGRLVCEVGVAVAAPSEFIVFRVGRRDGVVEVTE